MHPVFANMIWPALFLESVLMAPPVIILSLIIEYFFVRRIAPSLNVKKAIFGDLLMNLFSMLLGIILIPLAGIIWEIFPGLLFYYYLHLGTFNPLTWTATFCFSVLINAAIESWTLRIYLKQKIGWDGFRWLLAGNALTVGLALFVVFYFWDYLRQFH